MRKRHHEEENGQQSGTKNEQVLEFITRFGIVSHFPQEPNVGKRNAFEFPEVEKVNNDRNRQCKQCKKEGRIREIHQRLKVGIFRDWGFGIRETGIGNRESGIGNWELGIGMRESVFGIRESGVGKVC